MLILCLSSLSLSAPAGLTDILLAAASAGEAVNDALHSGVDVPVHRMGCLVDG